LILRLYESLGGRANTTLHFCKEVRAASQTDMLEDNPHPLPIAEGRSTDIDLEFRAFEIKTIRVKLI
jgi:alpha-mannosidase